MSEFKNKDFFPHPSNLRNDRRMKRVMKDLPGGVGYGAVVILIERLRCEENYSYPIADLDLLSDEFDISLPILQTVISKYGFFELIKDEVLISPVLNTLMDPYTNRIEQAKIAGQISAQKRKIKQEKQLLELSKTDSTERSLNGSDTEEKRLEEKIKENKIKEDFAALKKLAQKTSAEIAKLIIDDLELLPSTKLIILKNGGLANVLDSLGLSSYDTFYINEFKQAAGELLG